MGDESLRVGLGLSLSSAADYLRAAFSRFAGGWDKEIDAYEKLLCFSPLLAI